jgi:rod shape-determining protein MreD
MQPTNSSRRILLPVKGWFIFLTLFCALFLNMLPLGRITGVPDWVALVLAFWCVREPLKVGMFAGFVLGLIVDVADASLMGQHALAYVLLAFAAAGLSRRILWFPLGQQALHVMPLLFGAQLVMLLVRMASGAEFPGLLYLLAPIFAAVLWFPLTYLLLIPQFRPVDRDENRPI